MKRSLTLKQSTFLTIISASACLILSFTYLHLSREADRSTQSAIRETYLGMILAKKLLESNLRADAFNYDKRPVLKDIENLVEEKGILPRTTQLLDPDGTIVFPAGAGNPSQSHDQKLMKDMMLTYDLSGEWFKTYPSPSNEREIQLYAPIFSPSEVRYFLKTTVSLENLKAAFQKTYQTVMTIFFLVAVFALYVSRQITSKLINPIRKLSESTREIARGNLTHEVVIDSGDEIEELARSFNDMAIDLGRIRAKAEDANPLTHLPGNNVIMSEVTKRLDARQKIAVIHCDLDRFKIYNDLHGIRRGDDVIRTTAEVLKDAVDESGEPDDLVAHEGGDDFVIVTDPKRLKRIAQTIMRKFDAQVGNFYRSEDKERGYITIRDRRSKDPKEAPFIKLPLMSISLAAVTNETRDFQSYTAIATVLAETKKKAKEIEGNSFVVYD